MERVNSSLCSFRLDFFKADGEAISEIFTCNRD